jgi:hypothetical protein
MQGGMTSCTEESLNVIVNTVPLDNVVCERDKHQRFVEDVCEVIKSSIYDVNKFIMLLFVVLSQYDDVFC